MPVLDYDHAVGGVADVDCVRTLLGLRLAPAPAQAPAVSLAGGGLDRAPVTPEGTVMVEPPAKRVAPGAAAHAESTRSAAEPGVLDLAAADPPRPHDVAVQ